MGKNVSVYKEVLCIMLICRKPFLLKISLKGMYVLAYILSMILFHVASGDKVTDGLSLNFHEYYILHRFEKAVRTNIYHHRGVVFYRRIP